MPVVEKVGSGRPVILVHGSPGDRGIWKLVAERTPPGFASWIVELPGHGDQPDNTGGLGAYLGDLRAVVEAASGEAGGPVILGGLSIGAYLALRLCGERPDRVSRVLACGGFAAIDPEGAAWRRQLGEGLRTGAETVESVTAQLFDALVPPADRTEEVDAILRRSLAEETPERLATLAEAAAELADPANAVTSIPVPATVMQGRGDPLVPLEAAEALAALGPEVHLEVLETASHELPLSHPAQVAQQLFR